jgi:hypothetical protein
VAHAHKQLILGTLKPQILANKSGRLSPNGVDGIERNPTIHLQADGAIATTFEYCIGSVLGIGGRALKPTQLY